MATRMQQRRGTASQWTTANPILAAGEIGFETDTGQFKIGDGINTWSTLSYFKNLEDLGGNLDDYILLTEKGAPNGVATLNENEEIPLEQLTLMSNQLNTEVGLLQELISSTETGLTNDIATAKAAAEVTAQGYVDTHASDSTNVHGISDTAELETQTGAQAKADNALTAAQGYTDTHSADTTNVHGIADTSELATKTYADGAVSTHSLDTTSVHGIADTADLVTKSAATQTLSGDLVVSGSLTVEGTTTTVNATDLVVTDPLIYIGEGNSANLVDLGLVSSFNDGTYQHSGIVRDSSAGKWKVFKGVTDEPTTTVNFSQGSLDDIAVNNIEVAGVVFPDGTQTKQGVPSITSINQQTAAYTSVLTDRDKLIEISSQSAVTFTIPTDASVAYPVGTSFDILQTGTGQVTVAGANGVTVNATPGLKLRAQWSSATIFKRAADTWVVFGDLSA